MQFSPGQDKGGTNRNVAPGKGCRRKAVREDSVNKAKKIVPDGMAKHPYRETTDHFLRPKQVFLSDKRSHTDDLCVHHPTRGDSRFYRDCPGLNYPGLSGRFTVRITSFSCLRDIYKEWIVRLISLVGQGVSEKT